MAEASDRASPVVFGGRDGEFDLLDRAVRGTQRGEAGHTVVVKGVPGAGKTALLNEYADRLLRAEDEHDRVVVPVPMQAGDLDAPPEALVRLVDDEFKKVNESSKWRSRVDQWSGRAALVGNMVFAAATKRRFGEFLPSARAAHSIKAALDDYMAFKLDDRPCTVVLLVDEAQNLNGTNMVKRHLQALHGGIGGRTQVLLACFGLGNTDERLADLGLSRLATDHVTTISVLDKDAAKDVVKGTVAHMVSDHRFADAFDEQVRREWIGKASAPILSEGADFPHHLANGCRALAAILLRDGIGDEPPVTDIASESGRHKRSYYEARLRKWSNHTTALACAFEKPDRGSTRTSRVKRALSTFDNDGDVVAGATASAMVKELRAHGYIESNGAFCRPALPSMASHFRQLLADARQDDEVLLAVRQELAVPDSQCR